MDTSKIAEQKPTRARRLRLAALGLSSAAAIGLAVGMGASHPTDAAPATEKAAPAGATQAWPGYADLIEQIMPSVVAVTAQRAPDKEMVADPEGFPRRFGEEGGGPDSEMFRRFMERFFGEQMPPFGGPSNPRDFQFEPPVAMGSGFIIGEDGLIVTNNHVVDGASEVTVKLNDGTELEGKVIGKDTATDLALVKVEPDQPLQAVRFADSERVRVGDAVIAIGSPFGLGGTVTAGIVSADHRVIGAGRYDDFLQIDAPINRGNSGGPTFNLEGEVIGVNTAIQSPTGGNVGIGFAIPSNMVVDIVEDLRDDGQVERGWLGVYIQQVDEDLAKTFGLEKAAGALVSKVTEDSPAAKAGVQQGDVVLKYQGTAIEDVRDLTRMVGKTDPGTATEVVVWRDGQETTLDVDITQMPDQDQQVAAAEPAPEDSATPKLGLALSELTPEARSQLDLPAEQSGVVVTDVAPGSPAAEKGLRPGDVIIEANRQKVGDPASVAEAVRNASEQGSESVLLLVRRDGQDRFVAVPIERA
jgi:serine protease Do